MFLMKKLSQGSKAVSNCESLFFCWTYRFHCPLPKILVGLQSGTLISIDLSVKIYQQHVQKSLRLANFSLQPKNSNHNSE